MYKRLFSYFLMVFMLMSVPMTPSATSAVEIVDNDFQAITISINSESVLRVTGATGETLYIYNITGVRVMSIKVDGADKSYNLNLPKGCYIVKVGKMVRKISIR
ncbi:T9SS type A sorting domain-containing protein [Hallella colorans]|uniref:T9SS type A sorting domain-containing protein n=1 Tax=Hallella colorans TaxID=1703337 RepID=UPI0023F3E139|nr:T9SS type A sorting domain-containing protein [Hallella colorans]